MTVFRTTLTCVGLALAAVAQAAGPVSQLTYNPQSSSVEGNMPYTTSFPLAVTAPGAFPIGASSTISFNITPTSFPSGMSMATATSFISLTPAAGQPTAFTSAGQTITYIVTLRLPIVTPPAGSNSVFYSYQIKTAGWPVGIDYSDMGASINATTTVPPPNSLVPPFVAITTPATAATFSATTFP